MPNTIDKFFGAWGAEEAALDKAVSEAMAETASYADPRSGGVLAGAEAVATYVKSFGANAPGWTARVIKEDTIAGCVRATVAFGGPGPDGDEVLQHGQYFVEMDGDRITRMIGFVGTGAPA
jgi:hypothetical protein